jgi:hypothetical protein
MLELESIQLEDEGKKVLYRFNCDARISCYFSKERTIWIRYDSDVSGVPKSLLIIPFLANVLPISWFVGFDISIDEIDEEYLYSVEKIKQIFARHHLVKSSLLHFKKIISNKIEGVRPAILFSGGVDSHFSYISHEAENPLLVTIHGADIRAADRRQFRILQSSIEGSLLIRNGERHLLHTNIRDFYTYRLNLLFDDLDWWGRVQHGLAITGLIAPLSYVYRIDRIYIASSTTKETEAFWGSTPLVDNEIKWAGVCVVHDGYEADRAEKVDALVKYAADRGADLPIKVCYSSGTPALNCSQCDKCCRTILLLVLAGADPNRFGFRASEKIYDAALANLANGYSSELIQYVWNIVLRKINESGKPFVFSNEVDEKKKLAAVAAAIESGNRRPYMRLSRIKKFRYRMQLKYPDIFNKLANFYRFLRSAR